MTNRKDHPLADADERIVDLFLARQPIFTGDGGLAAYELLYRCSEANVYSATNGVEASLQVIANTLLSMGLDKVLGGRKAFINFPRDLLLEEWVEFLPPDRLVVEVLESVERDRKVMEACGRLRRAGYELAVDDFSCQSLSDPLLDAAQMVKVDLRAAGRDRAAGMIPELRSRGLTLLAEKVETPEEFEWAKEQGFTYYQGYFFARPAMLHTKVPAGSRIGYLRILREIYRNPIEIDAVDRLIRSDVALCQRLLQFVNSAALPVRNRVTSVGMALVMLGETQLRKWAALAALPGLASGKPPELTRNAVVRAHFCEHVAGVVGAGPRSDDFFAMGLFSHLDAMLDVSIEQALLEVPLADDVARVLTGKDQGSSPARQAFELVRVCESGDWDEMARFPGERAPEISRLYLNAIRWTQEMLDPPSTT